MKYRPEDIFTPQGTLEEVERNPNLDFLMNIFNIPRAFGVSGFGKGWDVGTHSICTAFLALFWAKYNSFSAEKRDRLVTMAILHDMHEAVTGDILPMFKAKEVRKQLDTIQENILTGVGVKQDKSLDVDLKIIDLVAFLYEIKQVSPSILNAKQLDLAHIIADKQRSVLFEYCKEMKFDKAKIQRFLKLIEV